MEATTPGAAEAPAKLEGEALQTKVQETLESLLSKKNLVRDQFLAGNMNPQMYIPIKVLMAHEKVIASGATEDIVAEAATKSAKLGIDDAKTMVRPLLKSKRNVIILRDMPEDSTEEEIRGIFKASPHSEKLKSIKAEVNNAWFVKFDLDDGTQEVVLWLRSQQFKGKPVNASIKSEHFLRSFFPLHPPTAEAQMSYASSGIPLFGMGGDMSTGAPMEAMGAMGFDFGDAMKGNGKGMMGMPPGPPGPLPTGYWQPWGVRHTPPPIILPNLTPATASAGQVYTVETSEKPKGGGGGGWQDGGGGGAGWQGGGGWKGGGGWQDNSGWQSGGYPRQDKGAEKGKGKGGKGKGKGKGGDDGEEKGGKGKGKERKTIPGWPAEPEGGRKTKGDSEPRSEGKKWKVRDAEGGAQKKGADEAARPAGPPPPLPPATYSGEYRKYGRETFEEVCKGLSSDELKKPEALEQLEAVPVFRETPLLELAPPAPAAASEA